MLQSRPHIEPKLNPAAKSVVVKEIYLSLQGESSHQGLLCSFVRLTGCHLRCSYCDSEFAFQGGKRMDNSEIVSELKKLGSMRVEITGGEPLLQPGVYPLMQQLLDEKFTVLLETSGAIDVRLVPAAVHKIVDIKTPSSNEVDRNDFRNFVSMNANDEVKFVIGSKEDFDWSCALIAQHQLTNKPFSILFSTVFGKLEPKQLAEWIIEQKLPVRFQLQQHKYLWEPNQRGV